MVLFLFNSVVCVFIVTFMYLLLLCLYFILFHRILCVLLVCKCVLTNATGFNFYHANVENIVSS